MSGVDLQDRLALPIIVITAHDDAKPHERVATSGAIGHLRKPCEEQTVLDAIRGALRASKDPLSGWDGVASSRTRPMSDHGHPR